MKKRMIALALALVMAAGLVPAAAAAGFPDVAGRWSESYINEMTERGLYEGYEDGTFRPLDLLTTGQAIALCVRMSGFGAEALAAAEKDYGTRVTEAVSGQQSWFRGDFSAAVAAGIVTLDELEDLSADGKLVGPLTREEFSVYLVRALGLAVPTDSAATGFGDDADIADGYRPYVSVLRETGIVEGDTNGNFAPKNNIKREDSATMFSRAVNFIEDNSLLLELYDYEDYDVKAGTVVSFEGRTLTINNFAEGDVAVTLPTGVAVYDGNRLSDESVLTAGSYVRVCSREDGIFAVRAEEGRAQRYTGTLAGFGDGEVSINTGTRTASFKLDRATLYAAGGRTGGIELYDAAANYTSATAIIDPLGRLAVLSFEGGSRYESVFITSVDSAENTISVETHAGEPRTAPLADNVELIVPSGAAKYIGAYIGSRCDVRVDNTTGEILSIEPDTEHTYVRGGFVRITVRPTNTNITITSVPGSSTTGYRVADAPTVTVNGVRAKLADIEEGMFVTMRCAESSTSVGTVVDEIEAYDAGGSVDCVLNAITYGKTIAMSVTYADGTAGELTFEASEMPKIMRGDRVIYVDRLRAGDKLTITTKYWRISLIEVDPAASNLSGTIKGISITDAGTTVTVERDDGTTETYPLAATADILRDGREVPITSIQGMHAAMTLSAGEIVSIEVNAAESIPGSFSGRILVVNTVTRELLVERDGTGAQERVYVDYDTRILRGDGSQVSLSSLEPEMPVNIYYELKDGVMTATIIIVAG